MNINDARVLYAAYIQCKINYGIQLPTRPQPTRPSLTGSDPTGSRPAGLPGHVTAAGRSAAASPRSRDRGRSPPHLAHAGQVGRRPSTRPARTGRRSPVVRASVHTTLTTPQKICQVGVFSTYGSSSRPHHHGRLGILQNAQAICKLPGQSGILQIA